MTPEAKPLEIGQKYLDAAKAQPCRVKAVAGDVIQVEYGNGLVTAVERTRLRPFEPFIANGHQATPEPAPAPAVAKPEPSPAPERLAAVAKPAKPTCGIAGCDWQPNTDQPSWWDMAMAKHRSSKHAAPVSASPSAESKTKATVPAAPPPQQQKPDAAPSMDAERIFEELLAEAHERFTAAEKLTDEAAADIMAIEDTRQLYRQWKARQQRRP